MQQNINIPKFVGDTDILEDTSEATDKVDHLHCKEYIGLLGAGNMGRAIYQSLIKTLDPKNIWLCDPNPDYELAPQQQWCTDLNELSAKAGIIFIAVKPQIFKEMPKMQLADKCLISIMAGINEQSIANKYIGAKVVRTMFNLGISKGNSNFYWHSGFLANENLMLVLKALGNAIQLKTEQELELVTIINGCGPAIFSLFASAMEQVLVQHNFSVDPKQLINQTLIDTAGLIGDDSTYSELINKVASKGGVTREIVSSLQNARVDESIGQALHIGLDKIKELAG